MRKGTTARLTAVAVLVAAVVSAAGASSAQASTAGCTGGVYAGYCGTQTSAEASPLSWDVFRQRAAAGNKIIGYPDSSSDRAVDFFTFGWQGSGKKVFEYAPDGVASNLCVSEPFKGAGLVLAVCSASSHEQFTAAAAPAGFTWTNVATGDIVQSAGLRGQLAGVAAPGTLTAADEWSFAS